MTRPIPWQRARRLGPTSLASLLLLQTMLPAHAVSTGYSGFVSQLPGVYTTPPDVNVMFTLDDSLSMYSDAIPDILPADAAGNAVDRSGMAAAEVSNAIPLIPGVAQQFPNMWGAGSEYLDIQYYTNSNATAANRVGRFLRSSSGNPLYYNPLVRYRPWPLPGSDQTTTYANANTASVNIHPTSPFNTGRTIDLTKQIGTGTSAFWPATYFTTTAVLPFAQPNSAASTSATFTKIEIVNSSATAYPTGASPKDPDRTDCTDLTTYCSNREELQNFANWLQFYRSRMLMAKGGVAAAFAKQGTNMRVGFGTINNPVSIGVTSFTGTARAAFYNQLYPVPGSPSGTPLREALDKVGKYFLRNNVGNPWAQDPASTTTVGTEYTCRRSAHILSTDGYWNGNDATAPANNNNDAFSGNVPDKADGTAGDAFSDATTSKFGISPFSDGNSNTLADVAAYYWKTDLRSGTNALTNNVTVSPRDPANWQHLTQFTIGLGVNGSGTVTRTSDGAATWPIVGATDPLFKFSGQPMLFSQDARDYLIANKVALTWPTPSANAATTGDDLIHASMNGRGRYFSATDPTQLAAGLASALAEVADQPSDFASVSADAPQVQAGGKVYQATFSPANWYGRLYAFTQAADGSVNNKPTTSDTVNGSQVWEASNKMPLPAARNIYTSNGAAGTGTTFLWANLTSGQQGNLSNDSTLLDYLRGDASNEVANGGTFRDRSRYTVAGVVGGVLGDVVNGSPTKGPDAGGGYDRLPSTDPAQGVYANFRGASTSTLDDMRNTIFLGANDGMLHAFNIADGIERFAYVPSTVYNVPRSTSGGIAEKKLALLADPTYTHRFTVDGTPNISDAYLSSTWKTLLTASTGAGARGIYVMDVSKPVVGSTGFGASKIMWEFSETNDSDMGFVLAYPHIARMRNGKWGVIFGNGYDSVNGKAVLFILDASNGSVIKKITLDSGTQNGLSQPNFVLNSNREVTAIYAGDLKGNLWKVDVSATNESSWATAFGTSGTPVPLITAFDASGNRQPISVMPEISAHPNGGAVLSFGTGKLFESSDTAAATPPNVNLNTQAIYGIWDNPAVTTGITMTGATRATVLQTQSVTTAVTATKGFGGTSSTSVDWSTKRGWYIDLESGGERVNLPAQQVRSVLFVIANKPVSDPCSNGGCSKMFVLDPVSGAAPKFAVFDTDGDGKFENTEKGQNMYKDCTGLLTQPIFQLPSTTVGSGSGPGSSYVSPAIDKDVIATFNRGQVSGAKPGGVELSRETSGPCGLEMTAALSNTSLLQGNVNTCFSKGRISWRQLK